MRHGRDHQQREAHVRSTRTKNIPDSDAWQTKLLTSGRKRGMPPEGLIGPETARRIPTGTTASLREREILPPSGGSEVAPTARAAKREQERHARERALGRVAAGTMARRRGSVAPGVKREDLERAGREADAKVSGRSKGRPKPR
jgi:hypothetical protein